MTQIHTDKNLDEKCIKCGVLLVSGWDLIVWTAAGPLCADDAPDQKATD